MGSETKSHLSIIIPTACAPERRVSLMRALASISSAAINPVEVVMVVNGQRVCEGLLLEASQYDNVRVIRRELGSAPLAIAAGRESVSTPFFGVLDDDDELCAGALDRRLAVMLHHPSVDVVVSNGWREEANALTPVVADMSGIAADPLHALLDRNYLASCAGLFRSASVSRAFFLQPHGYGEWTWLCFQLSLAGLRFAALTTKDYVVHDSANSLSKSDAYFQSYVSLFDRMLAEKISISARKRILQKRSAAYHDMAERALSQGDRLAAAQFHWRSLRPPTGLRYLAFSRYLLTGLPGGSKSAS